MSEKNLAIVKRAMTAGDPEELIGILDENVEWDYVGAFPESRTYHGPDAVREFLHEWAGAFEGFGFEAEDLIDVEDSVVVHLRQWGRGKETGADVENRTWQVLTLRDGWVIRCRGYNTKTEALEAAGRSN